MNRSRRAPVPFFFTLRRRLLFLICLATLPAILFTFLAAENERTAALARTERDALHLSTLAGREHTYQIQGARDLLTLLGANLAREGRQSRIITDPAFLQSLLAGWPQLSNVGVLSPDGQVLTSAYPLSSYDSWNDNPAYVAALASDDVVAGTYIISPIFDRPTLNHAYAVRGSDGSVFAVLFNGLNLEWLSDLARQSSASEGFSLLIVDHEDRVLAWGGPANRELRDPGAVQIPGIAELARSQRASILEMPGAGMSSYFLAAPLEAAPGLFVAVGLPYDQVTWQANASFYRTLVGLGVLTVFTITAVFIAAELGILRGVRSLARAAQRFGAGDLSARAKSPPGHNEFSALAAAFNTMADALAARHAEAVDAQARLRALASRLHIARETEAARISRELHDEIGQVLTSLKIDLSRLATHCPSHTHVPPCTEALREEVGAMSQRVTTAMEFVRRISSDLRPSVLDKLGLTAALEWQAREIEARTDLVVQVEADEVDQHLDEPTSVTLLRIAQEALTNVVRHAQARVVEVGLATSGGEVILTVHDDGRGITTDSIESGDSIGLIGMRERAMLVNGRLSIHGAPGEGTTVSVSLPLPAPAEADDAHTTG